MREVDPIVSGIAWGANDEQRRGRPMRIRSRGRSRAAMRDGDILVTRDFAGRRSRSTSARRSRSSRRARVSRRSVRCRSGASTGSRGIVARETNDEQPADAYLDLAKPRACSAPAASRRRSKCTATDDRAEEMQAQLARQFPGVQVKTWKEINRPLFLALRLEKIVMFVTISLIIFVAALNLISSLSMLILEKRPSVGVLRTLGATERTILVIFLEVGLLIGLSGTILGNIFGLGLSWAANHYHLVPLPRRHLLAQLPAVHDRSERRRRRERRRDHAVGHRDVVSGADRVAARSDRRDPRGSMRRIFIAAAVFAFAASCGTHRRITI